MKRFYKAVSVSPTEEGFAVMLDGKPIKTPKRKTLSLRSKTLAEAVAGEWRAQGDEIKPVTMPITRLVNTRIDGGRDGEEAVIADLVRYGGTDLLCYRADEPEGLVKRQEEYWQPLLDWAQERHGIALVIQTGITPVEQSRQALDAIHNIFFHTDGFSLSAAHLAASLTGSVIISLALLDGRLDADAAWMAARVDEDWQTEQWGEDEEAARRARASKADLDAAVAVMRLMRQTA